MEASQKPKRRVVIAGGSGFLGRNLARFFMEKGDEVVVLARHDCGVEPWQTVTWDGRETGHWCEYLAGASALINLVGRTVDCIKTPDHCDEILRSRVESTRVLGQAMRQLDSPPAVWVQMSTAHRYGDPPDVICDESSAFGYGLAPYVGEQWELAFTESVPETTRQVILRTSFVLGKNGGALKRLAKLVRWGLGGKVGSGKQWISWIHEHDMNRLFAQSVDDTSMSGAYIASAPNPVNNSEFMRGLRRALRMPIGLPAAKWMVRIGAPIFLRTDPDLAICGRRCVSRRLREMGFEFTFPELESAFADIYGRGT